MTKDKVVLSEKELQIKASCMGSLLFFIQYFFELRTGREFKLSNPTSNESHFITVCRELTKCFNGESTRLIINLPPGWAKSTLCKYFTAWASSWYPDSNFLYVSHGIELAAKHTHEIKQIMEHPLYKKLFGIEIRQDSSAKDHFTTTAGGTISGWGAKGGITGYDAGLPGLDRFSGALVCFPYDELIQTEYGQMKIGEVVENKIQCLVPSVNLKTMEVEYKPITAWQKNPGDDIIEITFTDGEVLRCTPDHKIWTDNRGWVEARNLTSLDSQNCTSINPINGSQFSRAKGGLFYFHPLVFSQFLFKLIGIFRSRLSSNGRPRFPSFNLPDNATANIESFAYFNISSSGKRNINSLMPSQFGSWPALKQWKSAMYFCIGNVFRFSAISEIVQTIISTVAIKMPDLQSMFLFANKSPCYQSMNMDIESFSIAGKSNPKITVASIINKRFKNALRNTNSLWNVTRIREAVFSNCSFVTSYSAKIRNTIKSFPTRNRSPLFIRHIGHVDNTYCITVADNHNFFAGLCKGLIVSNCDDLHKPDEIFSQTSRQHVKDNYIQTLERRLRSPNVPVIMIGQRLHEDDLPGNLIGTKENGYTGFDGYKWNRVIIKALDDCGNAVYPELNPKEMLLNLQEVSPYVFASQYQQNPQPAGGGIFKKEWFQLLDEEPEILGTLIVCDTAETNKTYNDATVFNFMGLYRIEKAMGEVYGLHCIDCRELWIEPKDLESEFTDFYARCARHPVPPQIVAIEKKSTGSTLLSVLKDFRGCRIIPIERTAASGSKTTRMLSVQSIIASKRISFPTHGEHTEKCIDHMAGITANDTHKRDDIADTIVDSIKIALIDRLITATSGEKKVLQPAIARKVMQNFKKSLQIKKRMSW